jgi:hypothetical protein
MHLKVGCQPSYNIKSEEEDGRRRLVEMHQQMAEAEVSLEAGSMRSKVSEKDQWTTVKSKNGTNFAKIVVENESESLFVGVLFLHKDFPLGTPF